MKFDTYVIRTVNLNKRYNQKKILDNITLNLEKGKIHGLIGQNGAGKTTLIKIITGLAFPSTGDLEVFGCHTRAGLVKARESMGCMVEHTGLYPNLTAQQNLTLIAKYKGIRCKTEISRVLSIVGLQSTGDKTFKQYSMGMKQRLGIAAALLGNPELLILDEPMNGLDLIGIAEIRNMLSNLNKVHGITILISSHMLGELHLLATDYIIIDEGRVIDQISLDELNAICRKHIIIQSSQIEQAAQLLDSLDLGEPYILLGENKMMVPNQNIDPMALASAFHQAGIVLTELSYQAKGIEDYVIDKITGRSL
jgi:ABC-2 type transport system ATP-binding protein